MDVAYDHIQESNFPEEHSDSESPSGDKKPAPSASLNADLQDAYRAFSSSPWGARIGGFFGTVVKQGESVYREAQQELSAVGQDATRGLTTLRQTVINHTRNLSLNTSTPAAAESSSDQASRDAVDNADTTPTAARDPSAEAAFAESETVLSRLRGEAAKRLKDLQKAEDAADEALLRFGSNLRDFFRDAITIAPPSGDEADGQGGSGGGGGGSGTVLFESKDAHGKRVIHTSRFDAQLHVIHTSPERFVKDGTGAEFEVWTKEFDVDKKTAEISGDLDKYPELRATMEKLVPDQVAYVDFWKRYYFLRHGIETAEARRRDLLKAAAVEEEVGWDEESDEEEEDKEEVKKVEPVKAEAPKVEAKKVEAGKEEAVKGQAVKEQAGKVQEAKVQEAKVQEAKVPAAKAPVAKVPASKVQAEEEESDEEESDDEESEEEEESEEDSDEEDSDDETEAGPSKPAAAPKRPGSTDSSTTIHPPAAKKGLLKPSEPRKSDEKSQAGSDTSYDVVGATSGVPSQAPNSPRDSRKVDDDSDEEDWE